MRTRLPLIAPALGGIRSPPTAATRRVHGHVFPADHDDALAQFDAEVQIHVQQEFDGPENAVRILALHGKRAAHMRADGDEHRLEAFLAKGGEVEVPPDGLVHPKIHAQA